MDLIEMVRLILSVIALFIAPGFILYACFLRGQVQDRIEQFGIIIGTSIALLPVLLLFSTSLGIQLNLDLVLSLAIVFTVVTLLGGYFVFSRVRLRDVHVILFACVFAVTLFVRLYVVKDLQIPMWGDSYQHTVIAQLIQERGQVPSDYAPYADLERFTYHFGFHTVTAFFAWIAGIETHRATLLVGQLMNAFAALSAYTFTIIILNEKRAALISALLVGLVFTMPAYFVNWGRYTQLTGLVIFPVAFDLVKRLFENSRLHRGTLIVACLVCAGLFLTHYAVTFFLVLLIFCYLTVLQGFKASSRLHHREVAMRAGLLLCGTAFLVAPWLFHLASTGRIGTEGIARVQSFEQISASVPKEANQLGRFIALRFQDNYHILLLSVIGLLWGALSRFRPILFISLWVLCLFTLPLLGRMFSPTSAAGSVLSNFSSDVVAISLFLPLALSVSSGLCWFYDWNKSRPHRHQTMLKVGFVSAILFVCSVGAIHLTQIRNPSLDLVKDTDLPAMNWIRQNVPANAKFLTNIYFWGGNTIMGSDAGYWIPILAQRSTLVPPLLYTSEGMPRAKVLRLREIAQAVQDGSISKMEQLCRLRAEGIGFIFVGSRPGNPLTRSKLEENKSLREIYHNGETAVFEILPCD